MHSTTTCVGDLDADGWRPVSMCVYCTVPDAEFVTTLLENFLNGLHETGAVETSSDGILVKPNEEGGLSGAVFTRWKYAQSLARH